MEKIQREIKIGAIPMDQAKSKFRINDIVKEVKKRLESCAETVAPLALTAGIILLASYLWDMFSGGEITLGESSAVSKVLFYFGILLQNLITPVTATLLSTGIGGASALPAGLICGYIAQRGMTFQSPASNTNNTTGVFGGIIAGLCAGLLYLLMKSFFELFKKGKNSHIKTFLTIITSTALSVSIICTVNASAGILRFLLSALLSTIGKSNKMLLSVITGALIPADPIGALHLSAYDYATSTLSTGSSDIMASVMSAVISVTLGAGISSVILRKKFSCSKKICGISNCVLGLGGIRVGVIPLYISSPFKAVISFIPGGILSSVLSMGFRCEMTNASGGLLNIASVTNPVLFVIASLSGGIMSSALFILFNRKTEPREQVSKEFSDRTESVSLQ